MLGFIFGSICILSVGFGICCGNTELLGGAILDGAEAAVTVTLSLLGLMCLWNGLLRVFQKAGLIRKLSRLLAPLLRHFFPRAFQRGVGTEEITACISANLLGIGNAATPLALSAMEKLKTELPAPDTASDDMITLAVLNSAPLTLFPASLIALRRAADSADPFAVMVPIWIASAASALFALLLTRLLAVTSRKCPNRQIRFRRKANHKEDLH